MDFKNKYLKYKNKYYNFVIDKKMEGGNPLINIPIGVGIAGIVGYISNKLFSDDEHINKNLEILEKRLNFKKDTLLKLINIIDVIKKSELKVILELIDSLLKEEPKIKETILSKYGNDKEKIENDPFLRLLQDENLFRNFINEMNAVLEHGDMGRCLSQDDYSLLESKLSSIKEELQLKSLDLNNKNNALGVTTEKLKNIESGYNIQELEIADLKRQLEKNNQDVIALEDDFERKNIERDSILAKNKEDMLNDITQREEEMKRDIQQREEEMKKDMLERESAMMKDISEKEELSKKYLDDLEQLKKIDIEKSILLEEQILRNKNLESKIKSKEEESRDLKKEKIDSGMKNWNLKGQIRASGEKLDKSEEEERQRRSELIATQENLDKVGDELFNTQEVLRKAESDLEQSKKDNIDLRTSSGVEMWKAKAEKRVIEDKLKQSDDLLKMTEGALVESLNKRDDTNKKLLDSKMKNWNLKGQVLTKNDEIDKVSNELNKADIKLAKTEGELVDSEKENSERLSELIATQEKLDKTGDELYKAQEVLRKTESDLEKSKKDNIDLTKKSGLEMWKAKGEKRVMQDNLKYTSDLLNFTQEKLEKSLGKNNSMRIRDNTKLWMMRNKLNNYMKELDDTKSSLDNTEMQLRNYLFELNESNKKRDRLQEDLEEIIEKNNNLDTSNEELKKGKAELDREIIKIKNELKEISEDYENAMNSTLKLIEENKNQDGKINNLEEQLEIEKKNTDTLVNKRDELNNKLRSLRKLYSDIVQQFEEKEKKSLEKVRSDGDLVEVPASPSNEDKKFELSESPIVEVPASPTKEEQLVERLKNVSDELEAASQKAEESWGLGLGEQLLNRNNKPIKQAGMSEEEKETEKKLINEILSSREEDRINSYLKNNLERDDKSLQGLSLDEKIKQLEQYLESNFSEIKKIWEQRIEENKKNKPKNNEEIQNFLEKENELVTSLQMGGEGVVDKGLNSLVKVLVNKVKYNNNVNLSDYNKKILNKINKKLNYKIVGGEYIKNIKKLNQKIYKILSNKELNNTDKNMKLTKYFLKEYKATIN